MKHLFAPIGRFVSRPTILFLCIFIPCRMYTRAGEVSANDFSFIVAGDMRNFVGPAPAGKRYFDGLCEAAEKIGPGSFMISPGDCDPPAPVRATIDHYLGTNFLWYPVAGNHDAEKPESIAWMRHWAEAGIPHLVRRGPPGAELTTYSFDFGDCHFVMVNDYYDGHSDAIGKGDVPVAALAWLTNDLAATKQSLIFVAGHKPLKSFPDMDTHRSRHGEDSISANAAHREQFIEALRQYHVCAYICGHTHDCSIEKVEGVWQTDSGHARGAGDTGAPSTFLKFRISGSKGRVDVYRSDSVGIEYKLRETVELN